MSFIDDGIFIPTIMKETECDRHQAGVGTACWGVYISITNRVAPAVCGRRIRKAGYAGQISAESLRVKPKKKAFKDKKAAAARKG